MKEFVRHCANPLCRRAITGCNGFLSSSDQLKLLLGQPIRIEDSVELCGRCILILNQVADDDWDAYRSMQRRLLGEEWPPPLEFA